MGQRRLSIVLDLDTGKYSGRLTQAGTEMKSFGGSVDKSSQSVRKFSDSFDSMGRSITSPLQKLRDYVLVVGNLRSAISLVRELSTGWITSLVKQSAEIERLSYLMQGLSKATTDVGRQREAQSSLAQLIDMARRTGIEMKSLTDAFVKFKSAGLDPKIFSLDGLVNANAAFGGNSDTLHRASIAIQQMAGKGVISMEELRQQLGEAVPTAMQLMADSMNKTLPELTKLISTGTVAAKPAIKAMLDEMERVYGGQAERLSNTLFGQIAKLKTNLQQLALDFTGMGQDGSFFSEIVAKLKELNELMRTNEARKFMADVGTVVGRVASGLVWVIEQIVRFRDVLMTIGVIAATGIGMTALLNKFNQVAASIGSIANATGGLSGRLKIIDAATAANIQYNMAVARGTATALDSAKAEAARAMAIADAANAAAEAAATEMRRATASQRMAQQEVTQLAQQRAARERLLASLEREKLVQLDMIQTGRNEQGRYVNRQAAMEGYQRTLTRIEISQKMLATTTQQLALAEERLAVATGRATAATETFAAAEATATAAVAREEVAVAANTAAKVLWTTVSSAAAAAARLFGAAVNIALGPIGIIAMLIYQAADAMGVFESKADKAAAAAKRMAQGFAEAGDAAIAAQGKASLVQQISALKNDKWGFINGQDMGTNIAIRLAGGDPNAALIKQKEDELKSLNSNVIKGKEAEYANRTRDWYNTITDDVRKFNSLLSTEYAKKKSINDRDIADQQKRLSANQALRDQYDAKLKSYKDKRYKDLVKITPLTGGGGEGAARRAALAQLTDEARSADDAMKTLTGSLGGGNNKGPNFETALANAAGQAAKLNAQLSGSSGNLAQFNAQVAHGKFANWSADQISMMREQMAQKDALSAAKKEQGGRDPNEAFDRALANTAGKIAELRDQLGGGEGDLAKFEAKFKAGAFEGVSSDRINQMREYLKIVQKLNKQGDFKDKMDGLEKQLVKATAEGDALWKSFNAGTMEADKRLAAIRGRFEDRLIGLTGKELEEARAKIERIVAMVERAEAADTTQRWKDEAEQIRNSLMQENDAREANFQRELRRQQVLLDAIRNNAALGADEKRRAEEQFNAWKRAADAQLARQNEGALLKQARDWSNLGQNIQTTMASALGSIVDAMLNANQSFGDLVANILKQILKVILQALIAYAILSALGMANNSSGAPVSLGDFMKGQMTSGFSLGGGNNASTNIGYRAAPTHHTGGVIGKASAFANVPADVFNAAKTYHGGGWIGGRQLKQGEVPMIGLDDEVVLTKEQQRLLGKASFGQATPPNVQVNVINNSGKDLDAEQGEPEFNGKDMIVNVVVEAAQKQGRLRNVFSQIAKQG